MDLQRLERVLRSLHAESYYSGLRDPLDRAIFEALHQTVQTAIRTGETAVTFTPSTVPAPAPKVMTDGRTQTGIPAPSQFS